MEHLSKIKAQWLKDTDYFRITINDKTIVIAFQEIYKLIEEIEWQQKDYYAWKECQK